MTPFGKIRHSLNLFNAYREGDFIFKYEDDTVTVYKQRLTPHYVDTQLMLTQSVISQGDACDFIEAFLKKV